jgi:DNA-binding NtrC family response regulator
MNESIVVSASAPPRRLTAMIGGSEIFQRAHGLLRRYAACNAPVLIEGETGTGKELAAREIHYASARSLGPFVPVNCGALPDALLESELFGHRRGAFTDARSSEPGLVEYARGGTLFLDEIDSLSTHAQTTLLRFLQNGEFRAVGERALRIADVRIVAATNLSLAAAVEAGRFRRDLFYRLNPLCVSLPPLRERGEDVALIARHLLDDAIRRLDLEERTWAPEALELLQEHDWPGNVRELENVILRVCMRSDLNTIGPEELALAEPAIWQKSRRESGSKLGCETQEDRAIDGGVTAFSEAKQHAIRIFERKYLIALMDRARGNISHAALLSGTERRQLGKMLKRYGIERNSMTPV